MKSKKNLNLKTLQKEIANLKKQEKKVVFTNGCFDLIHAGHVRYLTEARNLGEVLVVAVNSDASVRKLKGKKRPIVSQAQRLEVLSGFWFIDYLILFSGNTPKNLITALTPDILVKGGDWSLDQIVGRDHVEAHGGKVVRIKLVKNTSTTSLIDRVLTRFQDTK
ncbi:MAG: D-glycero-beta-D-manno-heptose 1-phosphate adenylyltransferase [Nitrospirota bacterium]|nr:D-glycero-beta-D-manno-heptose 1-phosphate adenylyltransferase [Nitrospirota bacterium]